MDIGQVIGDILAAPFICIGWLIVGAIAGALAHQIMGSKATLIVDIILGLVGSAVGNFLLFLFNINRPEGGLIGVIASLVIAVIGAVILIALFRALSGRRVT
jgi:uncharacterized membrane protein YeaQ/YmgE (transglycosylase-associated protein family)